MKMEGDELLLGWANGDNGESEKEVIRLLLKTGLPILGTGDTS